MSARGLLEQLHRELAPVEQAIASPRFVQTAPPLDSLRAFAGEQSSFLRGDRRSFALLAARFPEPPAGDLFLALAQGEGQALEHLRALAFSLGIDERWLGDYRPQPGCQADSAFVAWLALGGPSADQALAFLANLDAWDGNCGRLVELLAGRCDTSFFEFFAAPPPGFEEQALAVADQGLESGDSPEGARRAARVLQADELLFWGTLADELQ
jgi:TENA/THI-4/PQQC family